MITGKYCFVQFSENISGCEIPIPVKNLSDVRFFIDESITQLNIDIVNVSGSVLREFVHSFNYFATGLDLAEFMAPEDCFRLKLKNINTGNIYFSNVFMYLPDTEFPLIEYWCDKPEFGFPYEQGKPNRIRIPAVLEQPSWVDEDEKYTDSNGRTRILYKEARKKYIFKTDYLPYNWHDKIKIIFMHDLVTIDDKEFDEVGTYSLGDEIVDLGSDWECVPDHAVMGETEVAENSIERNTNC